MFWIALTALVTGVVLASRSLWRTRQQVALEVAALTPPANRLPDFSRFRQKDENGKYLPIDLSLYAPLDHLKFVVRVVESRAEKEVLQEEALLSSLHDRIVNRTDWYKVFSDLSILSALVVTFISLFLTLRPLADSRSQIDASALKPILGLVGTMWPLILLGMLLHGCSAFWQHEVGKQYDAWRQWLESEIFPELGSARSTLLRLDRTMDEFNQTARDTIRLLTVLQGVPTALEIVGNAISTLAPAMAEQLSKVSFVLSPEVVLKLTKSGDESLAAVKAIQANQATILSITEAAERRTTELATAVNNVAENAGTISKTFQDQSGTLNANTQMLESVRTRLIAVEGSSKALSESLRNTESVSKDQAIETRRLTGAMQQLQPEITAGNDATLRLTVKIGDLHTSVAAGQQTMHSMLVPLERLAESLPSFLARAQELQGLWKMAMTEMAAVAGQIMQRASTLDQNTQALQQSIADASGKLGSVTDSMTGAQRDFKELRKEVAGLKKETGDLLIAYGNLRSTGEKLKELAETITGNFERWRSQTEALFSHAESASRSADASMNQVLQKADLGAQSLQTALAAVLDNVQSASKVVQASIDVWRKETAAIFDLAQAASASVGTSLEHVLERTASGADSFGKTVDAVLDHTQSTAKLVQGSLERTFSLFHKMENSLQGVPGKVNETAELIARNVTEMRRETAAMFKQAELASQAVEEAMAKVLQTAESGSTSMREAADAISGNARISSDSIRSSLEDVAGLARQLKDTIQPLLRSADRAEQSASSATAGE